MVNQRLLPFNARQFLGKTQGLGEIAITLGGLDTRFQFSAPALVLRILERPQTGFALLERRSTITRSIG